MGKFLLWVVILVIVANLWGCFGCLEEERIALLQVKAHIDDTYMRFLPSWVDEKKTDCCKWSRVTCSVITKRVIELDLSLRSIWLEQLWNWYINASIFLPFKHLNYLDLSYSNLNGEIENGGFDKLSKLHNLEELDLTYNQLNRSILSSLSHLSSLKYLNLSANPLDSPPNNSGDERLSGLSNLKILNIQAIGIEDNNVQSALNLIDFTSLEELDLSYNKFQSFGPNEGKPKKLEKLNLSLNKFNKSVFQWLRGLPSLKVLHLDQNNIHGLLHIQDINALSNLEELSLPNNYIQSFETSTNLSDGRRLTKLESLDLGNNKFNINIFKSLKGFPSLKILDLGGNDFQGQLHIQDINALTSLEDLDLSYNSFENFEISTSPSGVSGENKNKGNLLLHLNNISANMTKLLQSLASLPSIKGLELQGNNINTSIEPIYALRNLSNLEELFLDDSYLHKDFLQSIGSMNSLKVLSVSGAHFGGIIPNKGWCELRNLQEIYFIGNELEGMLPSCLRNLTALRLVDLSFNMLTGNIGSSPLSTLVSLEYLSISDNYIEVPSSFRSFANHSKLRFILVDQNHAIFETEVQSVIPKFQRLEVFSMSNCGGILKLPRFLHYQNNLKVLMISGIKLEGVFPNWLLQNNTKLEVLSMNSNAFTGTLKFSSTFNLDLKVIDISNNKLSGEIPSNLSLAFPNIMALNLSYNSFTGQIPSYLGNLKNLEFLDLSNNSFMGEIPKKLLTGCTSLLALKLSNNNFDGEIVPEFACLSSLRFLYLDGNNFTGNISDSFSHMSFDILDISDNKFSGKIPRWMRHITSLEQLTLSKNRLEGHIPVELCYLNWLRVLDLSANNLTGSIPSCLNPESITHVRLSQNHLEGPLTRAFFNNTALVILDLSYNGFVGRIPEWIGGISRLSILLLKGNQFVGQIPIEICQLTRLSVLDLSNNHLIGKIPGCLGNISLEVTDEKSTSSNYIVYRTFVDLTTTYAVYFSEKNEFAIDLPGYVALSAVEFTTKGNSYEYEGSILKYMSGIDLSINNLIGQIPYELGNLTEIRALNLSHNNFSGMIPEEFSKLHNIESLDLSHNRLGGKIPNTLLNLNTLEVFTVAYNNLSGAIPEPKAQFATFNESSYEGNPYLCGLPLHTSCSNVESPSSPLPFDSNGVSEESNVLVDLEVFYISIGVSYVIFLIGVVLVLWINPNWRNTSFQRIEVTMYKWFGIGKN